MIRWIPINKFRWHACTTSIPEPPWQLEKQEKCGFHIHGNLFVKWVQSCVVRCSASSHHTLLISAGLTVNTPLMFAKYVSMAVYACKWGSAPPYDLLCVCVTAFPNCHAFVRPLGRCTHQWLNVYACVYLSYLWWHIILSSTSSISGIHIVIGSTSDKPNVKSVCVCVVVVKLIWSVESVPWLDAQYMWLIIGQCFWEPQEISRRNCSILFWSHKQCGAGNDQFKALSGALHAHNFDHSTASVTPNQCAEWIERLRVVKYHRVLSCFKLSVRASLRASTLCCRMTDIHEC